MLRSRHASEAVTKPDFPLWAFFVEMTVLSIAFISVVLLIRRLRAVHPEIWEKLGGPSLSITWPGSIVALLERCDANMRLLVYPFRSQSFHLTDSGTTILLWMVRIALGPQAIFVAWSWWSN
jgi:hypothetical protein